MPPADQAAELGSTRVCAIPLKPPISITGSVVVPDDLPHRCNTAHVTAFGDTATT